MADRPNRSRPFHLRLPFWANSTLPPPRQQPLTQTPASTPLPPDQPQSPSQTPSKSPPASAIQAARPKPSQSPPGDRKEQQSSPSRLQVQSPMVARKASHPSQPSTLDSKEQPAIQNASRSPSKRASQPQPVAIQESSQLPSQPLPPSPQPKSPTGSISHSNQSNLLPRESQPVVQTKSPTQPQPELQTQTISQTQEMNPIQPAYMPQNNQPTRDLASKQNSVSSLAKDFPAEIDATPSPYPSTSEKEPKETEEAKPRKFPESKLDMQPSKLLKSEENSEIDSKEQPKTKAEANQEKNPTENLKPGRHAKGLNEDKSKIKSEKRTQEPQAEASDEPEKRMEAKLSSIASDTKPTRSSLKAGDIIEEHRSSKPEHSRKQENVAGYKPTQDGSSRKEHKIGISTMSYASFFSGERAPFEREIKEGLSRVVQNSSIGHSKRIGNGQAVSMITLAGENNGASMVIGSATHVHRGFKHDKRDIEASSDNVKGRWNPRGNENSAITASINSNVQSINNSTVHDSTCNARDPGIHMKLSSKKLEAANLRGQIEPLEPQKTAPSITPDQKPSHKPRIRRRCLRPLFMESSESDPENPQKPQRHGCCFNRKEKKKGKGDLDGISTTNSNAKARQVGEGTRGA
ncbi:muscle M-line assembly protein unc-89-like [Cocos nucifera]|uniref:Muscle M-line assembly protein unc-89-like n=1 Tax=Cocos nucifera TaxID=13894 RepID=A0A8K0IAL1_COCNU|nr:muscle M-line assembly protein unc-89-like [Cocos nucifera]